MKKFLIVSVVILLAFGANFLANMMFDRIDNISNLIDSAAFGIVALVLLLFFYSELFEPIRGQSKEFWKAIRKSIGKKSEGA